MTVHTFPPPAPKNLLKRLVNLGKQWKGPTQYNNHRWMGCDGSSTAPETDNWFMAMSRAVTVAVLYRRFGLLVDKIKWPRLAGSRLTQWLNIEKTQGGKWKVAICTGTRLIEVDVLAGSTVFDTADRRNLALFLNSFYTAYCSGLWPPLFQARNTCAWVGVLLPRL